MALEEEIVVPFGISRADAALATAVRSTLILSSHRGLRARGHFDPYLAHLDATSRERMTVLTAGAWLPMSLARAHYAACDALDLAKSEIEAIGWESGRFVNQTLLSGIVKLSKEAGVSPWSALKHTDKLSARTWQGGACGVFKLGPKEARLEWLGLPLSDLHYFRTAFAAFIQGIISLFSEVVFVREIPKCRSVSTVGYRLSWV